MFQLPSRFVELQIEHRHEDGSWASLERAHHDPASHDPERQWKEGALFQCTTCDEHVRVAVADRADTSGSKER